jgi:TPR repeat protein
MPARPQARAARDRRYARHAGLGGFSTPPRVSRILPLRVVCALGGDMRNVRLFLGLVLLVLAPVGAAPALAQQAGVALVVANANYPDAGTPLPYAIKDATAVADEFRRINFSVDLKKNLRKEEMRQAINAFLGKIKADSAAVFYFSGFGLQVARRTYLVPVNAQIWSEADVSREGIGLDSLLAEMHRKGADVKIVIIDAARRNPFERRLRAAAAGLAPVDAPVGTLVVYSTALGKLLHDRKSGANSLFVAELLKELHASNLGAEEIFNRVRVAVSRASHGEQVPWVASSMLGEYRLGGKPPNVPAATASNPFTAPPDGSDRKTSVAPFGQTKQASPPGDNNAPVAAADAIKPKRVDVTVNVGKAVNEDHGLLGVKVTGLSDELAKTLGLESARGAFVTSLTPDGPAERAGITPTDVIVEFDGRDITASQDLPAVVGQTPPGSSARAKIWRVASSARELADRLQRRAEKGDDNAAYTLAWLNLSQYGVLDNDAAAARWAKKAADDGHAGATYLLGTLYAEGHGVAKDEAEAVKLFRRAAEKNDVYGMFALAGAYARGNGIGKDVSQARHWYQKAADDDYAPAMAALGEIYANGVGVPKDGRTALDWYRKAAEKNNPIAIAGLGWLYERGNGVPQDYGQARRWYLKATEFNHPGAYYRLGTMAEAGHGVPKNDEEAVKWFRKAINLDNTFAMVALGLLYERGVGIKHDPQEALRLYKEAGEKGNAGGFFYAGFHYELAKDFETAVAYYAKAARLGDSAAMHNLGVAYDRGRGIGMDRPLAAQWIFKAITAGSGFTAKQMTDNPGAYSAEMRRYLQQLLIQAGVYDGPVNGRATPAFKNAVEALARRAKSG